MLTFTPSGPQITINIFGGIAPSLSDFLLDESKGQASLCQGINFRTRKFSPLRRPRLIRTTMSSAKAFIPFGSAASPNFFFTDREIEFARLASGGISPPMMAGRVLATGENKAGMDATGGLLRPFFINEETGNLFLLGLPRPGSFMKNGDSSEPPLPGATLTNSDSANADTSQIFGYGYTVQAANGDESYLSPIREIIASPGNRIRIEFNPSLPTKPSDGLIAASADYQSPVAVNLYRRQSSGAVYQRLIAPGTNRDTTADLPNNNIVFEDRIGDTLTTLELPIYAAGDDILPRQGMRGITIHQNNFAIGYLGNLLCFSEQDNFFSWPRDYEVRIPEGNIIGIIEFSNNLIVFIENGKPQVVFLDGPHPSQRRRLTTEIIYPCVAGASPVNIKDAVYYQSQEGLIAMSAGGSGIIATAALCDRRTWAPFIRDRGFTQDEQYFGFGKGTGEEIEAAVQYDPRTGGLCTVDVSPEFAAEYGGAVYFLQDGNVFEWASDACCVTACWESKVYRPPFPMNLGAALIRFNLNSNIRNQFIDGISFNGIGERGVSESRPIFISLSDIETELEFDLKNEAGISVVGGVYTYSETENIRNQEPILLEGAGELYSAVKVCVKGNVEVTQVLIGRDSINLFEVGG